MKDETFELLTKMYAEFSSFRKSADERFSEISGKVNSLSEEVAVIRKSQVHVEAVLTPKVEAALDGYKQVYEKLLEHDKRFDTLEARLDTHDTQIGTLKKKNA